MLYSNFTANIFLRKIFAIDEGDADSISMQEEPNFVKMRPAPREILKPRVVFL